MATAYHTQIDDETEVPEDLALAGRFEDYQEASEHSLVVLAMRESCWVRHRGEEHELYVNPERLEAIQYEFQAYDEDRRSWNLPVEEPADEPINFLYPYLAGISLIMGFLWQSSGGGAEVVRRYRVDGDAIIQGGEWWRIVTGLFLHADLPHLLGNLVIGLWYGILVAREFGDRLGWFLILFTGALGNLAVVWLSYPESHRAIGASTAVFAALGLLTGRAWIEIRRRRLLGWAAKFAPLAAALMLVSLTAGVGKEGVDFMAHLTGFASGVAVGALVRVLLPPGKSVKAVQTA